MSTPFLDQLDAATKLDDVGIFVIEQFLSEDAAANAFETLNSDEDFPWELKPRLYRQQLNQHAYEYKRSNSNIKKSNQSNSNGMSKLEELSKKVELQFDGRVKYVYCNRFQDPNHNIPYHTDTFGQHIIVLSLGSQRTVNFRNKKTKQVTGLRPKAGDTYFFPLKVNDTHEHCVCAAKEEDLVDDKDNTRLSFVFFIEPPKYAKEYKISRKDKLKGFAEAILSGESLF